MKINLLSFLLGGLAFLSLGAGIATSTEILTVKPAKPKSSVSHAGDLDKVADFVNKYQKAGYQTKSIEMSGNYYYGIVVMEKY